MRTQREDKNPDRWEEARLDNLIHPKPLTAETDLNAWCGNSTSGQHQWFTENHCSLADFDMTYSDSAGNIRQAKRGEVVDMHCDSVFCPTPKRPDCYTDPGICADDEWCMLNQQQVWSAAAGSEGGTSSPDNRDFCATFFNSTEWDVNSVDAYFVYLTNKKQYQTVTYETAQDLYDSSKKRCGGNDGMVYGLTWDDSVDYAKGARGRCVKYRQENESCVPQYTSTLSLLPKMEDGKQIERPLLCDLNQDLVCTGPNFDVLPSTCVKERPRDTCYLGPWWDSTICPRTETTATGGMDYEMTLDTVRSFLLLFPGDVSFPSECEYWDVNIKLGQATKEARKDAYGIVKALWPSHLGGKFENPGLPPLDAFEADFFLPEVSRKDCDAKSIVHGSEISKQLALVGIRAMRPNFIWSLIHFLMHNQPASSTSITTVSRNIAELLSQRFWCTNCRAYWTDVLEKYGLPPDSMNPVDHAKYWNFGHSVAGEHVATTRGDDPWIFQLGEEDVAELQNPFFISFEESVKMWTYTPNVEDGTLALEVPSPSRQQQLPNRSTSTSSGNGNDVGLRLRGAIRSS